MQNEKYEDITDKILSKGKQKHSVKKQKYFVDNNGIKYNVDGKHVVLVLSKREIEVANLLGKTLGGQVKIIPKVNEPPKIKTPDYILNNEKFDLKEITGGGKYVIEGNLRKKRKQANNFIIDLTNAKIDLKEAEIQIKSIYLSKRYLWVDKIFVIKENNIMKVFRRK